MDIDVVIVVNRTNDRFETMFDGRTIIIKPFEEKPMLAAVARNIVPQSYQRVHLTSGVPSHYILGIKGETDCSPIKKEDRVELLDRSQTERLQHSRPQVLTETGLEPIPTADVGVSPVSTPVTSALVREASARKRGKKSKKLKAKTLAFDNAPDMTKGAAPGCATSVMA